MTIVKQPETKRTFYVSRDFVITFNFLRCWVGNARGLYETRTEDSRADKKIRKFRNCREIVKKSRKKMWKEDRPPRACSCGEARSAATTRTNDAASEGTRRGRNNLGGFRARKRKRSAMSLARPKACRACSNGCNLIHPWASSWGS